jgi:hypothetical protein
MELGTMKIINVNVKVVTFAVAIAVILGPHSLGERLGFGRTF